MSNEFVVNTAIAIIEEDGLYRPEIQAEQLQAIFSNAELIGGIVYHVKELALASAGDPTVLMTTKKGRDAIKSAAAKVTRSRTYLDDLGKRVVAELKELPKLIDANRKSMREELDSLAALIRLPLTAFEERTKVIGNRLVELGGLPTAMANSTAEEVEIALDRLRETSINPADWDGLFDDANAIYAQVEPVLAAMVIRKRQEEANAAELARLRAESEKRAKQDAEDTRIKAAAEKEAQAALGREAEAKRQTEIASQRAAAAEADNAQLRTQVAQQASAPGRPHILPSPSAAAVVAAASPVPAIDGDRKYFVTVTAPTPELRKAVNRSVADAIDKILAAPVPEGSTQSREIVRAIIKGQIDSLQINYQLQGRE